jgi:hypothetical protein
MFWHSKPKPQPESLIAFLDEKKKPPLDPEKALSKALSEYETHYYKKVSNALDSGAEEAKKVVSQARDFITNSRLAYALCRPVFEHVRHWPSWSKHEDFQKYCNGPFRYIDGSYEPSAKPKTTIVTFSYNSSIYTLKFIDEGMFEWATDDMNTYGKLEIIIADKTVLGLDVKKDISNDLAHWWLTDVYALLPGPWMKELIEMAAYIDGARARESAEFHNRDALERAARIKLPE